MSREQILQTRNGTGGNVLKGIVDKGVWGGHRFGALKDILDKGVEESHRFKALENISDE